MNVVQHLSLEELEALAGQQGERRRFVRFRALVLARQGRVATDIASVLAVSRRSVQQWVERYNKHGVEGLDDRPKPGRPCLLDDEQLQQLRTRIAEGPQPQDGVCTLRGPEVQALLEREFGVAYSLPAVYFLLHRLGYSCLRPRPRHYKGDPDAQEDFKKK